jgi:uncharacterized membrane protein YidH (DUF202 family)
MAAGVLALYAILRGGRYAYRISSVPDRRRTLTAWVLLGIGLISLLVAEAVFEPTGREAARAFLYLMLMVIGVGVVGGAAVAVRRGLSARRRALGRTQDNSDTIP